MAIGDSGQRRLQRVEGAGSGRERAISDLRFEISEQSSKGFLSERVHLKHQILILPKRIFALCWPGVFGDSRTS